LTQQHALALHHLQLLLVLGLLLLAVLALEASLSVCWRTLLAAAQPRLLQQLLPLMLPQP
jgi:hypothetical protein